VSELTRDPIEFLESLLPELQRRMAERRAKGSSAQTDKPMAFHPPCTLQHGLKIRGTVEKLLTALGAKLVPVADSHLCCGSAGTYSVMQPQLSSELKERKLSALSAHQPAMILSANVGCITHLQSGTSTPVRHWLEWVDQQLA
jgi:glycolate oxidase iron-sulfur subunit